MRGSGAGGFLFARFSPRFGAPVLAPHRAIGPFVGLLNATRQRGPMSARMMDGHRPFIYRSTLINQLETDRRTRSLGSASGSRWLRRRGTWFESLDETARGDAPDWRRGPATVADCVQPRACSGREFAWARAGRGATAATVSGAAVGVRMGTWAASSTISLKRWVRRRG